MDDSSSLENDLTQCRIQIANLQRVIQDKDEMISSLRSRIFTMKSQMEVQKRLLEAEKAKSSNAAIEMTNTLVNDADLDDMTQSWLATELANPALSQMNDDEDDEEDDEESEQQLTAYHHAVQSQSQQNDQKAIHDDSPTPNTGVQHNRRVSIEAPQETQIPSFSVSISVPSMIVEEAPQISISVPPPIVTAPTLEVEQAEPQVSIPAPPAVIAPSISIESGVDSNQNSADDAISRLKSSGLTADALPSTIRKLKSMTSWRSRRTMFAGPNSSEPVPSIPAEALDELRSYEFDALSKSHDDLIRLVVYMYQDLHLLELFMIRPSTLASFVKAVSLEYHANPYHNFHHSADVAQTIYYYIIKSNVRDIISPLDILALVTSALCHDVGHPGQNNAFQINTQSEFARLYNDSSVLESHHAAKTFEILRRNEYPAIEDARDAQKMMAFFARKKNGEHIDSEKSLNILSTLSNSQFKEARKNMIGMILQTDMAKHFEMTAKLSGLSKKSQESDEPLLSPDNRDDREFLCSVLLHCADISNVTKPFRVGKKWADCVRDEFYQQGDLEKMYGLPVSPYMDREDSNQARTTLNFIDFVAAPLFTSVNILLRGLEVTCSELAQNRQKWQDILEQQLSDPPPLPVIPTQPSVAAPSISMTVGPEEPSITINQASASTISSPMLSTASPATSSLLTPDGVKRDQREMEKMAYRRRSVMVFQTLSQADETARKRSGSKSVEGRLLPANWLGMGLPGMGGLPVLEEAKADAVQIVPHIETKPKKASPPEGMKKNQSSSSVEASKQKQDTMQHSHGQSTTQSSSGAGVLKSVHKHGNTPPESSGHRLQNASDPDRRQSHDEPSPLNPIKPHGMSSSLPQSQADSTFSPPISSTMKSSLDLPSKVSVQSHSTHSTSVSKRTPMGAINPSNAVTTKVRGGNTANTSAEMNTLSTHPNTAQKSRPMSGASANHTSSNSSIGSHASASNTMNSVPRNKARVAPPVSASAGIKMAETAQIYAVDSLPYTTGGAPRKGERKANTSLNALDTSNTKALPPLRNPQKKAA